MDPRRKEEGDTVGSSGDTEQPGTVIGRYTLVRKLGEGGFGAVFMAEQKEPVRRQVALKIIKLGMDTRDVIARFELERQALALMDHPNVAKVLDAGATATGRPYFVMELVEGVPITEYCDEHRLSVPMRLEIMWSVCQAVQHAHGKGLIHRDLKPSNVLVSTRDGQPLAKVIDFGVAKATSAKLTDKSLLTEQFQMIGTPVYMSPEQAAGSLDIDTRTDVYSLGVLLYEILTSTTPVDEETLHSALYHEMQRLIREVEPPKPSTRIASAKSPLSEIASRRRTEPTRLAGVLKGDLDWIVMKALEKDPARRYDTASALAADIRRYLSGDAVLAAPPSGSYRVKKFVKRHKGPVAAGLAIFMALLAGLGGTIWQAREAARERDAARLAEGRALEAQKVAEAKEKEAEKVAEFQSSALQRVDPSLMGRDLVADLRSRIDLARERRRESDAEREAARASFDTLFADVNATDAARRILDANILAPASEAVAERFGAEPETEARLRDALAKTYSSLGLAAKALPEAERRLAVLTERLGAAHRATLRAQTSLGTVYYALGRLAESEAALGAAASAFAASFPADDPDARKNRQCIAVLEMGLGRNDEAKRILESLVADEERLVGPESADVAPLIENLATAELNLRDEAAAIPLLERARRINATSKGESDPVTLRVQQKLARAYQLVGRRDDAVSTQLATVATFERVKGERHPSTAGAIAALADIYKLQARYDEAEREARRALEIRHAVLGETHPDTINSLGSLAILLSTRRRQDEAEPLFVEVLRRSETAYGPESPLTLTAINNLGILYWFQGRFEEAAPLFARTLAFHEARGEKGLVDAGEAMTNLAIAYTHLRRLDEAEALVDKAIAILSEKAGPEHRLTLQAKASRATLLATRRDFARAETAYAELLAARRKVMAADDPLLLETVFGHGETLRSLGRDAEAEPLLREAFEGRRRSFGAAHPETLDALQLLSELVFATGRTAESRPLFEELLEGRRAAATGENATPATKRSYASILVDAPFEDLRDPAKAIELARAASEESGGADPAILDTLASALAAAGQLAEAAATERLALERLPAGSPDRPAFEKRLEKYEGALPR